MVKLEVIAASAIGAAGGAFLAYQLVRLIRSRSEKWVEVGRVKSLNVYPVKSFKSIPLTSAEVTKIGLRSGPYFDRYFVVSDKEGKFVTARDYPKFVRIVPNIENGELTLISDLSTSPAVDLDQLAKIKQSHPSAKTVKLWYDTDAPCIDCGDAISDWISSLVDLPPCSLRLLYFVHDDKVIRRIDQDKSYVSFGGRRNDETAFPDFAPVNLQSESSLRDLNSRFTDKIFSIQNFRPSIYVANKIAFDEDNWSRVKIGNATFSYAMPCTRCLLTTIDPETGIKDEQTEPLKTLRSYRVDKKLKHIFQYSPVFGANLLVDHTGVVHVGDKVYAIYK